jgi:Tfp pilus assembly protein PilN
MAAQADKISVQENKIAALEQENSKLWQEIHRVSELRLEYFQRNIYIKPPAERATVSY